MLTSPVLVTWWPSSWLRFLSNRFPAITAPAHVKHKAWLNIAAIGQAPLTLSLTIYGAKVASDSADFMLNFTVYRV